MTRAAELTAINCTNCGAGLDVLGGGRVITHVCGYCGSVLDAQHDYKVLKQFSDMPRPESPFRIGMKGEIQGVEYTIIGTLGKREDYRGQTWLWTDHQLFSPTHGYAWLTVEDGHIIFTRKMRLLPRPSWISLQKVERSDYRPSAFFEGDNYSYYATSTGKTTFVEGEFNWLPEVGDQVTAVALMSDDAMLRYVDGKTEHEIERSVYLPLYETCATFGTKPNRHPKDVHPLQPFQGNSNSAFARKVFFWAGLAALAMWIATWFFIEQTVVVEHAIDPGATDVGYRFQVDDPSRLTRVQVRTQLSNNWAVYGVDVAGPDGQSVFQTAREISYYSGSSGGESWTEGSRNTSIRFRPAQAGEYTVKLELLESSVPNPQTSLYVYSGATAPIWSFFAAALLLISTLFVSSGKAKHYYRRWRNSDWSDE
ncbi:DUF4178 domain-containing protein [Pseudaestuariivita rosea]|uniref:DUF4178 domain-containing protein n=1 Tax=Pseudaestuariivita rosea TaxID=2763263 RepID=UPI001ABBCDF2|nr:DUF4178 domain-containing protein [Pseudaestuariivita rosea]